ncbi:receptor-type guanylate cyclase Gyc76C-like isoform X2 [Argiope bruennichi]|uniref:receptor-type guanylate cyclase Gyc76C-like isoform X2 n=1 Tax=Argiope bruennichi TaxID=94029 RepID=UPI0024958206|nr:receptor-type guanylate cyclase Gyc76C-like isoform X2 [Argiope bruennichi]
MSNPLVNPLVTLLLLCYVCRVSVMAANNLTVGYLANIYGYHGKNRQGHIISGAMTYAVQQVNDQHVLPDNYTLEFIFEDTKGETLQGTNAVINMWRKGVIAFFGPENSCEVEATVSASLNLPMISYKCADNADKDDIANKDYKEHFARTYPPNTKVTSSVYELLRYYKWYKFSIIFDSSELYDAVYRSLERGLREPFVITNRASFQNTRICCYNKMEKNCCFDPFVKIVQNTSTNTRIYVFLGDKTDLGKFLTALQVRGLLVTGNYMVLYIDIESYTEDMAHKYFRLHEIGGDETVMMAAQSLLVLVSTPPRGDKYQEFQDKVREYNAEEPFKFKASEIFDEGYVAHITPYASYLYDAVTLYADALAKALRNGTDPRNGKEIMRIFRERTQYTSVTGAIMRIDKEGGAEGNYTILAWQPTPENLKLKMPSGYPTPRYCMLPVGRFYAVDNRELRFKLEKDILWVNQDKPPADEPPCGFDGTGCSATPDRLREYVLAGLSSILVILTFIIFMVYKNWKYEQEIDGLLWRLELEDIQGCGQEGTCLVHSASKMSLVSHVSIESKMMEQIFTRTAVYKGAIVACKQLRFSKKIVDISRKTKKEMKIMREMHHDNINQFIGACVDPNCVHVVTEYCSKGSLQDILENDDMKLDNMFIASLVFDLIKGMIFLHESDLKFHGNLKSSNCVVSSRWVLQVTDFGLHELRAASETGSVAEHQYFRNLLWKAPELLRFPAVNPYGTQKGDVYAFGIILHEIIARQGPFGSTDLTPREIIQRVKQVDKEPFRPPLHDVQCQDYIVNAMTDAWHERPENRPDFHHLKERLRKMREGMKSNIMDNMMAMMEKYAYNLEELVDERTVALVEEKKKTEALLHRMLPKSVANQLMRGEPVIPESFDAVTIYFSDIVGFTEMSASSTPMEVVTFLNDLYTVFDDIISHYDVYKVETIGDAYMVVSGLPIRNGDNHAGEIAFMALELLESIKTFKIRHKPNQKLKLRIGMHTGPVCAGVVGLTMPRYCLFGDTVNTASRMESNGEALKIHISPQCKEYLDKLGGYYTADRGLVKMKGKGEVHTYWLLGHDKGPKKRTNSASDSIPAQPLFNVQRDENIRRRSPKLNDLGRRGSLAGRRNSSFVNCSEDPPPSPGGVPVFLRLSSDSPKSPKRFSSFGKGDPNKLLKVRDPDSNSWYGSASASSCGELYNMDKSEPDTPRKPKLESIGSEDCDHCSPDQICNCRSDSNNRNGLINIDESLRPLLSTKDIRVDLIMPKDNEKTSSNFLKPPVLKLPSKKWRSCDEIILPKGSRSSLKEFFTGLLGNKGHEDSKRANNISMSRMPPGCVKEESLV